MKRFSGPAPTFHTARLVLRPLRIDDAPEVQRQFERFEVVRYLNKSVPWPYPPDGASSYLTMALNPDQDRERSWAITLDGKLIGAVGLFAEGDENRGFWLTPEYWGQGFMQEASDRVTHYALVELGWPDLVTGNAQGNEASRRIKRARGFELVETFTKEFVGGAMPYERWRVSRENWLTHAPPDLSRRCGSQENLLERAESD